MNIWFERPGLERPHESSGCAMAAHLDIRCIDDDDGSTRLFWTERSSAGVPVWQV